MHATKAILSTVALFFLAGCQEPQWNKPGSTVADFNGDNFACMQSSQQRSTLSYFSIYGGVSSSGQTLNQPLYNACMNAKGWTLQAPSANDAQTAQNRAEAAAAFKQIDEKALRFCAEPQFEPYYSKTACSASKITFEQLADTSKISPAARAIFLQVRNEIDAINAERSDIHRKYGGEPGAKRAELFLSTAKVQDDRNNLSLYSGAITWGEYNRRRQEIYSEYLTALNKITS